MNRDDARERAGELVQRLRWHAQFRPGSYYSPIPSVRDVRRRANVLFAPRREFAGIELHDDAQLELMASFAEYYADMPFTPQPSPMLRYHLDNAFFGYGDGVVLYSMLRRHRPPRVLEVGSGFSSALMLDVNERFLDGATTFTFIDPDTSRLDSLLSDADRRAHRIVRTPVQELADDSLFNDLEAGDLLFIDSSHVSKVGSDVNYLLLDVLPALAPGVLVHVHDIFEGFEYPEDWIIGGRSWNEAYLLRALLSGSTDFEVLVFNAHLKAFHRAAVAALLPLWEPKRAGSLWLRRT